MRSNEINKYFDLNNQENGDESSKQTTATDEVDNIQTQTVKENGVNKEVKNEIEIEQSKENEDSEKQSEIVDTAEQVTQNQEQNENTIEETENETQQNAEVRSRFFPQDDTQSNII